MPIDLELPEIQPTEVELDDQRTEDETREVEPFRYAISSYGADYPVDSLVKRMREESIYVPPFQRGFVWDNQDASKFIESLLLGLPVPGIFLSKEPATGRLLVVDGQQRLLSLKYFYDGIWEPTKKEFALKGVQPELDGRTYKTLRDEDRRTLDDAIMHAIIFKQDEPSDDESGVYEVFERLNSGGKKLTPHEVRSAVHHSGRIRALLEEMNKQASWRKIYGPVDARMRDQELVLRFLALLEDGEKYERPMVLFLNKFMGKNKNMDEANASRMKKTFSDTIELVFTAIGSRAFRPVRALNAAVFDAVMVGIAKRLREGKVVSTDELSAAYQGLLGAEDFMEACGRGTASAERVELRLEAATVAFSTIK